MSQTQTRRRIVIKPAVRLSQTQEETQKQIPFATYKSNEAKADDKNKKKADTKGPKFRIIKVGYAYEPNPDPSNKVPEREAMLYMFYPISDEDINYSLATLNKISFRLEVYDYRPSAVYLHKVKNKAKGKLLQEPAPGIVPAVVTAYEFDSSGQHTKGYGAMELIDLPTVMSPRDHAPSPETADLISVLRRNFHFSLTNDRYTDGHAHINSASSGDKPVFALSLRGPLGRINKEYAITRDNKLRHADKKSKTFFMQSEPLDILSMAKSGKFIIK